MVLTSLLELKITNIGTDFFWKVIGYQIYGTCTRFPGYSPSLFLSILPTSTVSTALPVLAVSTAYFLVSITSIEVAKTDISF